MSSGVAVHLSQVNRRWGCGAETGAPPVQTAVSPLRAVSESGGTNEGRSDRLRKKGEAHEESEKLTILHSNDMHGDFLAEQIDERLVGGVSLLSGYVNKVRRRGYPRPA